VRVAPAVLVLLALLTLSGCETTAEKSAELERTRHRARHVEQGLTIARPSTVVHVVSATLVHGGEGNAAAIALRNDSARTLRSVPIAITVTDARGNTVFQNNAPGLERALTQISSLPAHGSLTWVNDQIPSGGAPASITATVGQAPTASGPEPRIEVEGPHPGEEASDEVTGSVRNRSGVTQEKLVVYVIARRGGRIVAAGRAVLPEAAAGASAPFHAFLVGDPAGAQLQASVPATAFG